MEVDYYSGGTGGSGHNWRGYYDTAKGIYQGLKQLKRKYDEYQEGRREFGAERRRRGIGPNQRAWRRNSLQTSPNMYPPRRQTRPVRRRRVKRNRKTFSTRGSIRGPAVRDTNRYKGRRIRPIKVSRKFRKMVSKVISGKQAKGYYQKIFNGYMQNPVQGSQAVIGSALNDNGLHFLPMQILNAASVLWNKQDLTVGLPALTDPKYLPYFNTKLHIKSLWSTYELKSNSQRIQYLKMFICRPKQVSALSTTADTAFGHWQYLLEDMYAMGQNINASTPATIHTDPRSLSQWNKYWSAEVVDIKLEPGQEFKKSVQGPKSMEYDMAKMFKADAGAVTDTIKNIQKHSCSVFFVLLGELTSTQGTVAPAPVVPPGVDRARTEQPATGVAGVLFERNDYYSLSVPENAGWIVPTFTAPATGPAWVSSGAIPLELVRDAYCIYNTDNHTEGLQGLRFDELNPVLPVTAPVG